MIKKTYIPSKPRSRKLIGTSMLQSSVGSSIGESTTHTHSNKPVIDKLTQVNIDVLSYLSLYQTGVEMDVLLDEFGQPVLDINGDPVTEQIPIYAIKSTASFFSEKEVSAFGLGDEGSGGGGGFDMLLAWTNYSEETEQWVISAALAKDMLDRIVVLEAGSGGGGSTVTWGTESGGYVSLTVDSVAKSIALSTHTHSQYALTTHNHSGVYEPVFSKNTAFNKDFGTTSGTVAQGNDSRIINGQTAYGWGDHASAGYATGSALANYALTTHNHSGVYEPVFSKNTAFNKDFGTTSGTVAQGNDSRIVNGQTAYGWGNHASAGYASSSSLANYVTLTTAQTISGAKTFSAALVASVSVTTPKVIFSAAGWSLEQSGTELQMKYNGTAKMRFLSGGTIVATQEITAYG